jgi:hypothetical protein
LAFLISSILAGFLLGIPPEQIAGSIQKGIGGLLGDLVIVIVMGAMLGKLVAESGAAQRIADTLDVHFWGKKCDLGHDGHRLGCRNSFVLQCRVLYCSFLWFFQFHTDTSFLQFM